MCPRLTDHYIT